MNDILQTNFNCCHHSCVYRYMHMYPWLLCYSLLKFSALFSHRPILLPHVHETEATWNFFFRYQWWITWSSSAALCSHTLTNDDGLHTSCWGHEQRWPVGGVSSDPLEFRSWTVTLWANDCAPAKGFGKDIHVRGSCQAGLWRGRWPSGLPILSTFLPATMEEVHGQSGHRGVHHGL